MNTLLVAAAMSICSRHMVSGTSQYQPGFEQCETLIEEDRARAIAAQNAADAQQRQIDLDTLNRALEEVRKK